MSVICERRKEELSSGNRLNSQWIKMMEQLFCDVKQRTSTDSNSKFIIIIYEIEITFSVKYKKKL